MTCQISGDEQGNGNPKDGGIIGRGVLARLENEKTFLEDLSEKLAYIASDLDGKDSWPEVAAKFLKDLVEDIDEQADYMLPEIMKDTQTLVDALVKEAPFLPASTVEQDVIDAIVASRPSIMAHDIMAKAVIEVGRIMKERFSVLPAFPWVGDRLWSAPEGGYEGHGPVFADSGAERPVVCC